MELSYTHWPDYSGEEKNLLELSALIDADSFFYGIWDADMHLCQAEQKKLASFAESDLTSEGPVELTKAKFGIVNNIFTLVPPDEFNGDYLLDFLQHDIHIRDPKEFLFRSDYAEKFDIRVVYAIKRFHLKFINDTFHLPSLVHMVTAFLQSITPDEESRKVHLLLLEGKMILCLTDKNKLLLVNLYSVSSDTDILYFVSLIFRQFNLDPLLTPIELSGAIDKEHERYKLLSKYYDNLTFPDLPIGFRDQAPYNAQLFYPVYSIARCV